MKGPTSPCVAIPPSIPLCSTTSTFVPFLAAAIDETIQIFTGRGAQIKDVLLDFTGALTGILFTALLIWKVLDKRKKHTGM